MVSAELMFLHREKDEILRKWREYTVNHVNVDFFSHPDFVTLEQLEEFFRYVLEALEQNLFHDLNRAVDSLVERAHQYHISISDIKEFFFGFSIAAEEVLVHAERDPTVREYLRRAVERFSSEFKLVYSTRLGSPAEEILVAHRDFVVAKWLRDLPTGAVSPHFRVISREKRREFVHATFDILMDYLQGRESRTVVATDGDDQVVTAVDGFLKSLIDFFEPRGFAISDMERALRHMEEIGEPLLFKYCEDGGQKFRQAQWAIHEAVNSLALAFAEDYNRRMMKNYYNEVSIMLHRIKNKLTAVPTSLQTIMNQEWEGEVVEGDVMTPKDGQILSELRARRDRVIEAAQRAVEQGLEKWRGAKGHSPDLDTLISLIQDVRQAHRDLRSFIAEHRQKVEMVEKKLATDAINRVDEFLNDALEGGELTTKLTKELQDIQNELYRREAPVWEPLNLNRVVAEAFKESEVDARVKNINYMLEMLAEPVEIFGVEREIKRPFVQVINNAIRYTPEGGEVTVAMTRSDGDVTVMVQDTGIGIPQGEESAVFALCQRCTNAIEYNKEGSGTGLYNDRKTVLSHNGDMWVASEGEGKGSTFHIRLPIHTGNDASGEADRGF